jgi:uncharacterized membrane protein
MEAIRSGMEWAAFALETLAVVVIFSGVIVATFRCGLLRVLLHLDKPGLEPRYKKQVGNGLLMGLDLLVVADVIRTVTLSPTFSDVAALGLLVLVRIVLTWSLLVELEGRWPWQPDTGSRPAERPGRGKEAS